MDKKKGFIKETIERFKSSTPSFFKKIRYFTVSMGAAGLSLMPFKEELPERLKSLPIYLIVSGTLGTLNNSLPKKRKTKRKNKTGKEEIL